MLHGMDYGEGISDVQGFYSYDNGDSLSGSPWNAIDEDNKNIGQEHHEIWDSETHERLNNGEVEEEGNPPSGGFFQSQSFGQKFMGSMMDTFLLKNLTLKGRGQSSYTPARSSPGRTNDSGDQGQTAIDNEIFIPKSARSKCTTQLLFLGVLDSLQREHWIRLQPRHKIVIMDTLLSMVDFAASYNSYQNLRNRMQQFHDERPPLNLLRQEIEGTEIYLTVLHRTICHLKPVDCEGALSNGSRIAMDIQSNASEGLWKAEGKIREEAEQKLVSFCGHILKEAVDLQPSVGDAVEVGVHLVFALRVPIVVKVLNGLSKVEHVVFKKHLHEFYPHFTKLICCEQMGIRRALGDLFKAQLIALLP
eukprot:c28418_g1_i1 orf=484-1569(+)